MKISLIFFLFCVTTSAFCMQLPERPENNNQETNRLVAAVRNRDESQERQQITDSISYDPNTGQYYHNECPVPTPVLMSYLSKRQLCVRAIFCGRRDDPEFIALRNHQSTSLDAVLGYLGEISALIACLGLCAVPMGRL